MKTAEQSQNVYENKASPWKSTIPDPSLSMEGNPGVPSSDEEGLGWWNFAAWPETGYLTMKTAEQSQNVYENKGRDQKVGYSSGAVSGIDPPLTRLAAFATLSPGRGLLTRFIREPEAMREIQKSWERS